LRRPRRVAAFPADVRRRTVAEFPLKAGLVGILLAPVLAAIGVLWR
jgi:hypothetical protein